MRQEVAFLGMYFPALFLCAVAAAALWFVADALMLRLGGWCLFLHPPLARMALYFILLALVVALAPDY
jgi:hypothetical protein